MRLSYFVRGVLISAMALGLSACGDREDSVEGYQGKPDIHAWDSPDAGGQKAEWERQIQTRTLGQNEYVRAR
jgi:hypothetical protein